MPAAEVGAVALQELDLLFAEHEGGIAGARFQSQQALGAGFEIVSQPDAADAGGADGHAPGTAVRWRPAAAPWVGRSRE